MDTYIRSDFAFPTRTHPTQGIIPFSVVQSLMLCIPFQCYSGCAVRNNQPSRSLSEVPHALDLSSWSSPISTPNSTQTKAQMHTQQLHNLWVEENGLETKSISQVGENNPLTTTHILGTFGPNMAKNEFSTQ